MKRHHSTGKSHPLTQCLLSLLMILGGSLLSAGASAEQVRIPIGQQGDRQAVERPTLGMDMDMVRNRFGEPEQRFPARGEPPISRWEYPQFTVYFEGSVVLHSVLKPVASDQQ